MADGGGELLRSDRAWSNALADPEVQIDVRLHGHHHLTESWRIPPRELEEHLLYYLVRGSCVGTVAGRRVRASGGSLVWVTPGVPHRFRAEPGGVPLVLYNFRFRVLSAGRSASFERAWMRGSDEARLRPLAEQFRDDLVRGHQFGPRRLAALVFLLWSELAAVRPASRPKGPVLDGAARRALGAYLVEHAAERPTPAELAAAVGLSADYFARIFRRTFGTSPRKWLVAERIRLAQARLLDAPHLGVGQVAAEFGYPDVFLFSRQFRAVTGRSPSEHRCKG
jgi:AraC-like DNA-binding protein